MSIRRNHRNGNQGASNKARIARIRDKALRMRAKIKDSMHAMVERRMRQLAWWQRAFRTPIATGRWIFTQARALWCAILQLVGLRSVNRSPELLRRSTTTKRRRRFDVEPGKATMRTIMHEPLEKRVVFAYDLQVIDGIQRGRRFGHGYATDGVILFDSNSGTKTISTGAIKTAALAGNPLKLKAILFSF